jgi:hypothetical protein
MLIEKREKVMVEDKVVAAKKKREDKKYRFSIKGVDGN